MNFSSISQKLLGVAQVVTCVVAILMSSGCGGRGPEFVQPYELIEKSDEFPSDLVVDHGNPEHPRENNSFIVMFRTTPGGERLNFASYHEEYQFHSEFLSDDFSLDPRIRKIQFISVIDLTPETSTGLRFSDFLPLSTLQFLRDSSGFGLVTGRLARVDFIDDMSASSFLEDAETDKRIWFAEPNYENRLFAVESPLQIGVFDDLANSYSQNAAQWMQTIALPQALDYVAKSKTKPSDDDINKSPPIVAVLDTGIDYNHPGLKGRIWENTAIGAAGCPGDLYGCDTTNPEPGTLGNGNVFPCGTTGPGQRAEISGCNHGTHVSGIVAGNYNSGNGGVCPICDVMTLKVVELKNDEPKVLDSAILNGMKYLNRFRRSGNSAVRVVNSSFGKFARSRSVGILIDVLKRDGKGTLVVGAAGNEDSMSRVYPAAFSEAIAVSALMDTGEKTSFSNYGPWVDIAAPGMNIDSTIPGGSYEKKPGTSMAAPMVAGALGLMLAINPNASADELRSALLKSANGNIYAEDFGSGDSKGYNNRHYFKKITGETFRRPLLGSGQLNVKAFLAGEVSDAYVGTPIDRVTPGCGVIGYNKVRNERSDDYRILFMLFCILPFVLSIALTAFNITRTK